MSVLIIYMKKITLHLLSIHIQNTNVWLKTYSFHFFYNQLVTRHICGSLYTAKIFNGPVNDILFSKFLCKCEGTVEANDTKFQ